MACSSEFDTILWRGLKLIPKVRSDITWRRESESAELTGESFVRVPGFDINQHAKKAFGAFQNDTEYSEVVWKFKPGAASHVRAFLFHPTQVLEDQHDGSLIVRFMASGHLEMCWHLYMWGDQVEVLAPPALRKMVEAYQRSDFIALP